jgi:hypothetical protein
MTFRSRRSALAFGNDHTLLNALLLLICAVMSATGAGVLAILCFLPAAILAQRALGRWERHRHANQSARNRVGARRCTMVRGH